MEALTRQEDSTGERYGALTGPDKSDLDTVTAKGLTKTYCQQTGCEP